MPDHVVNEIIFRNVDADLQERIIDRLCDEKGQVDFEVLVPSPINIWPGSVGETHTKTFPGTHLDWAKHNWGTKWNAYNHRPVERTADTLILRFDTAWRPPYGWIVAIFNTFKLPFEHNWLNEGADRGVSGEFNWARLDDLGAEPWKEVRCDDEMQKHLHMLRWGVESFPPEEDT